MPDSFGARLRRRREQQKIALSAIAEQTKIKQSLLDALERDDVSHWPSGIFRRAYIRAYAEAIGLSADAVLREFLEVHPEPAEVDAGALASVLARDAEHFPGGPPTRLRYILGSAIESLSRRRRAAGDGHGVENGVSISPSIHRDGDPSQDEPDTTVEPPAVAGPVPFDFDWPAVAALCTQLARAEQAADLQALIQDASTILGATGLIVWMWDPSVAALRPALVHGYSEKVLAHVAAVKPDADNATAAAFRSGRTCLIDGSDDRNGGLVVPLLTPAGSAGVLALELQHGREQAIPVRAAATIVAALLAQLLWGEHPAEARLGTSICAGA